MLNGIGVSKGYGIGRVVVANENTASFTPKTACDANIERKRFNDALDTFIKNNENRAKKVTETIGSAEGEIILGHIMMIRDPYFCSEIDKSIDSGNCAELAVDTVCNTFIEMFSSVDDEFTRQRAADIKDIKTEMLNILTNTETVDLSKLERGTVLVARELTPSMTACINKENVVAIVTELGSKTSHAAILARAMEIPAVLSVENSTEKLPNGSLVIVNGMNGEVILEPNDEVKAFYLQKRLDYIAEQKALAKFKGKATITKDGAKVDLFGNIGTPEDAEKITDYDGEGIGLFRTEFLFMDRTSAPNENEQFEAYKKALLIMKGKPVIIRTLDIGGDKEIPYMNLEKEENAFLGFRAIRYCLKNPDFYKVQLKAILFEAYKKALLIMKGKPVIIRTLDIGGDKEIPYMNLEKEENAFLGFRAIRYCLKNPDFYKVQLKAILKASSYGDLSVMIPLVTGVEELRAVKEMIAEIMAEFDSLSIPYDKNLKIGVMIETPAAALVADILAKEADFFSIGTNDLTGYTLAVDRGNANVEYLYSSFAPSVLRSIKNVISEAKKAGIPVGMCGEAAADPLMIPLLISFGLDEYSVSATSILSTRREISRWSKEDADKIAEIVMKLDTEKKVVSELERLILN